MIKGRFKILEEIKEAHPLGEKIIDSLGPDKYVDGYIYDEGYFYPAEEDWDGWTKIFVYED